MTSLFQTIQVTGGLISEEYLSSLSRNTTKAQKPAGYDVPPGHNLQDEINRAWKIARALRQQNKKISGKKFAEQLLQKALAFSDLQQQKTPPTDTPHHPTHLAHSGAIPVTIAPGDEGLDKRQPGPLPGRKITPFTQAQTHINNSEIHQWGIVCDGDTLRLLRNSISITRPAYIEADLKRMLEEGGDGHYSDFRLLYLITHASRFLKTAAAAPCPLEQWREESVQTGIRAHEKLRIGVEKALQALGSGFICNQHNTISNDLAQNGKIRSYYRELLWLVYRLIFLLVTEERDILHSPAAAAAAKKAYRRGYSISRLRARATRPDITDPHHDLWEGVKHTFAAMHDNTSNPLALPALGGLFEKDRCRSLQNSRLTNSHLLRAIHHLSYFHEDKRLNRINYRDMGADELGSIYESLLELTPYRTDQNKFAFYHPGSTEGGGNTRKTSGSYYTTPSLVEELLDSALQPALEAINDEPALLQMRVLDPSCGSGHFLLAAARRMSAKLLHLRDPDTAAAADPHARRIALRDIISNCICGVDKNSMALDLAKTALWLEAFDSEKPLIFLDHHLQCGDSLLGVLNLDLLKKGIPDEAYTPATGDDKTACTLLKKQNKKERQRGQSAALFATPAATLAEEAAHIDALPEDDLIQVAEKRQAYNALELKRADAGIHIAADMYTTAFLLPKQSNLAPLLPTSGDMFTALAGAVAHDETTTRTARANAEKNHVFHWWLRYPAVAKKGGFDIILANPPWERIKLQEQEFFASREPRIAEAPNQNARRKLIAELGKDPNDIRARAIKQEFTAAKHSAESASRYVRAGGNQPLTGKGDVNTYALFAELCLNLTSENGAAGFIVPTGIAMDDTTKTYFSHLMDSKRLKSLYDFENRAGLFPSVDSRYRFSLLTIAPSEQTDFVVFAHQTTDLQDKRRRITLTAEDLHLVNPNTHTMPQYRTRTDRDLCEKIYRTAPILWREDPTDNTANPWHIKFQRIFDMSGDSKIFHTEAAPDLVRLYEAKYTHQYDHRWTTREKKSDRELTAEEKQNPDFTVTPRYWIKEDIMLTRLANIPAALKKAVETNSEDFWDIARDWLAGHCLNDEDKTPQHLAEVYASSCRRKIDINQAREYASQITLTPTEVNELSQTKTIAEFLHLRSPKWLTGWRKITNSTNEQTLISCIFPLTAPGDSINILYSRHSAIDKRLLLYSMFNSLVINYVTRQKMGGSNMSYFYTKQIPIIPPQTFTDADVQAIVPAVLELTYTASDMRPFYDDIVACNPNHDTRPPAERGNPFLWNDTRRALLRAEIEARIAIKYSLTRDNLRYILDPAEVKGEDYPAETFRILKNREIEQHGEYRTARLVLEAYDKLTARNL